MGSDRDAASTEGEEPLPASVSPQVEGRPKRRTRKPVNPKLNKTLPTTETGQKVADQVGQKLLDMVNAAALTEANRRRATTIDATDYEDGFDRIVRPSKRENAVAII